MKKYMYFGSILFLLNLIILCSNNAYASSAENVSTEATAETDEDLMMDNPIDTDLLPLNETELVEGYSTTTLPLLDIVYSNNKIYVSLNLSDPNVHSVVIPVWTEAGGQDDLIWHAAVNQGGSLWTAEIPLENHGYESGIYNIHAYSQLSDGSLEFITGQKENVTCTLSGNIKVISKDDSYGKLTLKIENISAPFDIKDIYVPVWSQKNGQDDIHWYIAKKSDDSWVVDIDALDHKADTGNYDIHLYYVDGGGQLIFVNSATVDVQMTQADDIKLEVIQNDDGTTQVTLRNYRISSDSSAVFFPVWSQNHGQDDIQWYAASQVNPYMWSAAINLRLHNYEEGRYIVHAYEKKTDGSMQLITDTTTDIKNTIGGNIDVEDINIEAGSFRVRIDDVRVPFDDLTIKVPVWSERNGQDDIIWYEAYKDGSSWFVDVDAGKHNYDSGIYHIHLYFLDGAGNTYFIQAITTRLDLSTDDRPVLKLGKNNEQSEITITLLNQPSENISDILFPVWSDNNSQDDLTWYTAARSGPSSWKATLKIANHSGDTGDYIVHAYRRLLDGTMEIVDNGIIHIDAMSSDTSIEITNVNDQSGQFRVQIRGVKGPSTITDVFFPVWSDNNGQDDIYWYRGRKAGDIWYADIDAANHQFESGQYTIHCYAYDARGAKQFIGASTQTVCVEPVNDGNVSSAVAATSWVIFDKNNESILFGRNVDDVVQLASQTKIMTAMVVLDHVDDLDDVITMSSSAAAGMSWDTTMAGLVVGRNYTVRTVLQGMLVYSGGDCAGLLAEYVAGSREAFVDMMNEKAEELGMYRTAFSDPVGLYNNHSTPREYMKLVSYADNNQVFRSIVQMPYCVVSDIYGNSSRKLNNSNGLVSGSVSYNHGYYTVDGMKTGFTDEAGYCLTASAYDSKNRIFAAVFNSSGYTQRAVDCRTLLDFVLK